MRLFEKGSPSGEAVLTWWESLQRSPGDRANLRRCSTPAETVFLPASHRLIGEIKETSKDKIELSYDRLCAIAGILAHIKENSSQTFSKQMSQKKPGSDQALVSDIRFRRVLQSSSIVEDELFFQKIIRVIHHLDQRANILDIVASLYFWGDSVKKRWAYDYYGTSNPSENENNTTLQGIQS
ncbi:MAG: type I-E CRISPR-associated protein Cse2/CasB [Leptospiraceae bacterium]|nr:type I-E CRISPR-associated protein Cse2/CasB [Leptospiraceae bacterium]